MKREEDNEFDRYIKTNMEYFPESDKFEEDWNRVAFSLNRNRFFKFSLTRFNIYYLSLLLILTLWFGSILYNSEQKQNERVVNTNSLPIQKDSLLYRNKEVINGFPFDARSSKKPIVREFKMEKLEDCSVVDSINRLNNIVIKLDSTAIEKSGLERVDSIRVKPKVKKIKYVVRRDTIIQVDTSKLRKKR